MKITFKGDYALKAVLDLALLEGRLANIEDIAKRQDIPIKFLEQILLDLKKGGFVKSQRGRAGGYYLAKEARDISMGDIIRYIEGPVEPIGCVCKNGVSTCSYSTKCALRDVFGEIGKYTADKIDSVTFEDLKGKQIKMENRHAEYYI